MNIFALATDPVEAAQSHIDTHCVKMVIELAQLLSAAHHVAGTENSDKIYKLTHKNHPCAIFTRSSEENYKYVANLASALLDEYSYRYDKTHNSTNVINWLKQNLPVSYTGLPLPIPLAMPDEYKTTCPIQSYRNYYLSKTHRSDGRVMMRYTKRQPPDWILDKYKFKKINNTWEYKNE